MMMNPTKETKKVEQDLNRCLSRYDVDDVTIYVDGEPKSVTYLSGYGTYVCSGVTQPENEWLTSDSDSELVNAIRQSKIVWEDYRRNN